MKKKKKYLLVLSLALFIHGQAQVTIGDITAPQPFSTLELFYHSKRRCLTVSLFSIIVFNDSMPI